MIQTKQPCPGAWRYVLTRALRNPPRFTDEAAALLQTWAMGRRTAPRFSALRLPPSGPGPGRPTASTAYVPV